LDFPLVKPWTFPWKNLGLCLGKTLDFPVIKHLLPVTHRAKLFASFCLFVFYKNSKNNQLKMKIYEKIISYSFKNY